MGNDFSQNIHFTAAKDCKTFFAEPESMDSSANLIPSISDSAFPPTLIPAPALKITISRLGPVSPLKILQIMFAFSSGSPLDQEIRELNPLTLKKTAEDIKMDISTISRSTNGKYAQLPWGCIELKTFFNEGIERTDGLEVSNTIIKDMIKDQTLKSSPFFKGQKATIEKKTKKTIPKLLLELAEVKLFFFKSINGIFKNEIYLSQSNSKRSNGNERNN